MVETHNFIRSGKVEVHINQRKLALPADQRKDFMRKHHYSAISLGSQVL